MNKDIFIQGYLEKIARKFNVNIDTAFEIFSIAAVTDKSFEEVFDNILVKGNKDGGIDGAFFVDQGSSKLLLLFQSKNTRGLKQNQIEKFRHDVEDIFVHGKDKPNTEDLQPKIDEYKQLSKEGYPIDIKGFFIYNGSNDDPEYSYNKTTYDALNSPDQYEIWDSNKIYGKINQLIKAQNNRKEIRFIFNPEPSNVVLSDKDGQALYTYSINNVRAANFRIKAKELCLLIEKELEVNGSFDYLFSENIRGFLGFRTRPNKRMLETLQDSSNSIYFPLLNNGITIICQKLELPSAPQNGRYFLPTYNPVIVNGLQTSRVIYDVYLELKKQSESDLLEKVFVNVRLYEAVDSLIIEKITDATNTQTPINYRDKVSNKDFSVYAKLVFENESVAYINKRGDVFSNKLSRELNDSVDSDTVIKFWYATFYEQPEVAKNSITKVLEEVYDAANNEHPLSPLFSGDKDSPLYIQLLHTYRIYKMVQKMRREKDDDFIEHTNELLSYGVYKQIESQLDKTKDEKELKKAYEHALKIVRKIVKDEIKRHSDKKVFSYNSYFKKSTCRYDYNGVAGIEERDDLISSLLAKR